MIQGDLGVQMLVNSEVIIRILSPPRHLIVKYLISVSYMGVAGRLRHASRNPPTAAGFLFLWLQSAVHYYYYSGLQPRIWIWIWIRGLPLLTFHYNPIGYKHRPLFSILHSCVCVCHIRSWRFVYHGSIYHGTCVFYNKPMNTHTIKGGGL